MHLCTTSGTPTGNATITVTGASGSQSRQDAVLLKVQTQTTDTFYPLGDTQVTGYEHLNENNGLATSMRIQHPARYSHVLLKFNQQDLRNTIGSGQVITATLKLYIETNFNNWPIGGAIVDLRRMTTSWEEYVSGSPAQGATWNCAVDTNLGNTNPDCATQWSGGSYDSTTLSSVVHQNSMTGWINFDSPLGCVEVFIRDGLPDRVEFPSS